MCVLSKAAFASRTAIRVTARTFVVSASAHATTSAHFAAGVTAADEVAASDARFWVGSKDRYVSPT